MGDFNRKIIIEKIEQILQRQLRPVQVYEWILGFVVDEGYEEFARQDRLAACAVEALMKINEDHKVTYQELKKLEYYRQCLAGEREYISGEMESDEFMEEHPPALEHWKASSSPETEAEDEPSVKDRVLHVIRVYIYVYAGYVLLSNTWALFHLGGPWASKRPMAIITYPFFVYGVLLLVPMQELIKGKIFLITMLLSVLTMIYYWFNFCQLFFSAGFDFFGFLIKLFLEVLPASLVVSFLVYEKYFKDKNPEKEEAL